MGSRLQRARRLGLGAVVAMLVCAVPAAAAPGWSITPSPNPTGAPKSYLDGVSCTGPTSIRCFAVGSYVTMQGVVRTLIERWNGTSWTVVASPNRTGALTNALVGVSCVSATSCFAVGNSQATPTAPALTLIERWNGTAWKIVPSPNKTGSTGNFLRSVSCVGPNQCFAVGDYASASTAGSTLIERWNGTAWSVTPSPNKPGAASNTLDGVSCFAVRFGMSCFAVGNWSSDVTGSPFYTLTERWNGSGWVVVASPNVSGQYKTALNAVSCRSTSFCMAVGVWQHAPGASVSERWNGAGWAVVPVSNPAGWTFSQLNSVSCASATSCVAVGSWSSGTDARRTLITQWNGGKAWAVVASPNPSGSQGSSLAAISCVGARCTAAGSYLKPVGGNIPSVTLTERNF